jgi:hypothetical protein
MVATGQLNTASLVERAKKIIVDPKTEWPVIEQESTTTERLYTTYIMPLAAIPVIAQFIGSSIIGITVPFVGTTYRIGIVAGIVSAVVSYVFGLVACYLAALVIDKLAPTFESRSDMMQALKLVAYAYTPVWIAGVLLMIPALGMLSILAGLYSIYLFYLGLPVMMKTPDAKVIPYMVVSALVIIVLGIVMAFVSTAITGVSYGIR